MLKADLDPTQKNWIDTLLTVAVVSWALVLLAGLILVSYVWFQIMG